MTLDDSNREPIKEIDPKQELINKVIFFFVVVGIMVLVKLSLGG